LELERTNDRDGEKILPSVLLTLAVMSLCRQEPPDKVIELLSAMCLKVERGDFAKDSDEEPPAPSSDDKWNA
jgi:hypothetical protein